MTSFVLDASITTSWLLEDEQDTRSLSALESVERSGATAPQHWRFEVANSLLLAERRGRLKPGRARLRLHSLHELPIDIDGTPDLDATFALAFEHGLTYYDALYLELAIRRELPLATLDNDLESAAGASGVEVYSG